jgi:hypothetical protein
MNRLNESYSNTDLYARIQQVRMSESERQVALSSIRNAESIVDGCAWAVNGVRGLIARVFEKPAGLKHSH